MFSLLCPRSHGIFFLCHSWNPRTHTDTRHGFCPESHDFAFAYLGHHILMSRIPHPMIHYVSSEEQALFDLPAFCLEPRLRLWILPCPNYYWKSPFALVASSAMVKGMKSSVKIRISIQSETNSNADLTAIWSCHRNTVETNV